ncbi:MAG: chromosomal replication initiator protein DnaA, partial [Deltaproteobacteria bacterium]
NQIRKNLDSKLTKSEFETWFSQTTLKKFDPDLAIIEVPNKFVANWVTDKYLIEIKKSFRKTTKCSPSIHFTYSSPSDPRRGGKGAGGFTSDFFLAHRLNPLMTFDRFLCGDSNQFASSSAQKVADSADGQYSPLYIYSGPGLGKTHLLNAVGNQRLRREPEARIRYLSADTFTSDFTYAIKNDRLQEFRDEYCSLDLLLFDDAQLLEHREKTQEEFLSIFNSLYSAKKQLVVTGDRPPNLLKNINPLLKSRLGWGILAEVTVPDQSTKIRILKRRAQEDSISIPDDVIFFLANSNSNIKSLIQNIIRLESYASLNNTGISISMVKSLVRGKGKSEISIEDIKATTAAYFNISVGDMTSGKKKRVYSYPRQLGMYLARKHTHLSLKQIGDAFGHKDHSTVVYAIRRVEKYKDKEKSILDDLGKVENLLG